MIQNRGTVDFHAERGRIAERETNKEQKMCQMCEVEPLRYGEILPDWFLCRATKDSDGSGVLVVNEGDWFLAKLNSGQASVIWTDEEEKQCIEDYNDLFWCSADTGYLITQSAMKLGFKPGKQNFNYWFLERLIEFKKTATVEYPSKETNNDN